MTAVGRLLAELDITPQKPLRRAYERDPVAIAKWTEEDYPKLKARAKRLGAEIFFGPTPFPWTVEVLGSGYNV